MKLTEWDINVIIVTLDYLKDLSLDAINIVQNIAPTSSKDTAPEKNDLLNELLDAQINITKILTRLFEGEE